MSGKLDIGPSVCGKGDIADLSSLVERGEGKEAHLILLGLVLIPLYFLVPVIVVDEVPGSNGFVVQESHVDRVTRVAAPGGRSLAHRHAENSVEEGEKGGSHV